MGFFNWRSFINRLARLNRGSFAPTNKRRSVKRHAFARVRVEMLEDRCLPFTSGQTFNQEFVSQLYVDLLQRNVDPTGLSFWSGQMDQGSSPNETVLNIESSPEYRSDLVNQMYETLLNRPVDQASVGYWIGYLSQHGSEQTEAAIAGSAEFFNDAGNTNSGFLSLLYEDVLHRAVDPAGNAAYEADLASGNSRADVALSILSSTEYRENLVQSYYSQFLHRPADPSGLSFWVGQLDGGASDQDVIAGLISSNEYITRAPAAPIVTIPASSQTVKTTTFTIQGTAENGSFVQIFSNGNVVGSEQLNGGTTNFSITVPLTSNAANNFTATAENSFGFQSPATTVPTITQSTATVTVTTPAEQKNHEGDTVSLQISATDSDSNKLTYSASGLPAGLSIDTSTGLITGTISTGDSSNSPYTVTVTATDSKGISGSTTFTWLVDNATNPVVKPPANQTNTEGDTVSGVTVTATEGNKNPLTYSATNLPAGLSINSTTGVISGTISTGDFNNSPYTVTVSATDGLNTGSATFTWTVNPVVVVTPPANQTNTEGDTVNGVTVTATDSKGNKLTYSAKNLPAGLVINPTTGIITGTIDASDASGSPYSVTVSATDGTFTGSATFTWTVSSVVAVTSPGNQANDEGDKITGLTVSATDSKSNPLTYVATGLPVGLSIDSSTGVISGTIGANDATGSPYTVIVTATDGTYSSSTSFTWTIGSAPAAPIVTNPTVAESVDANTFTIDGTAASGSLVQVFSNGSVVGTQQLASGATAFSISVPLTANSVNNFVVTATDAFGSQSPGAIVPPITESSATVTVTTPAEQKNHEGDSINLSIEATDSSSGTLTYSAVGLPAGLSINLNTGVITGTVTSGDSTTSPYTVTVTATDGANSGSATFTWLVDNGSNPVVTPPANQTSKEGDTVNVTVTATEGNSNPLTYSATGLPDGLSINPTTGVISGTIDAGDSSSSPYTITVSATDGLNTGNATFAWTISPVVTVTLPGNQTNTEGDSVDLSITANDSLSKPLTYIATGLPAGLSIGLHSGVITGTVGNNDVTASPYTVTVTVTDGTYTASTTFTWTIKPVVTVTAPANQTNTEGDTVSGVTVTATDTKGSTLIYTAKGLPSGLSINSSTGVISGTVDNGDAASGPYTVTVTATDGTYSASATFTWTVNLKVTPPATQLNANGAAVSGVQVTAPNEGGAALTYSATNLPSGLAINSSTGVISGTISSSGSDTSPYSVTVTASNGVVSGSATFAWVVTTSSSSTLPFSLTDPAWQTLPSGVRIWDVKVGTGAEATSSSTVTVNYTGYLTDGTIFDSNLLAKFGHEEPFTTSLSSGVIVGWMDGIPGMKVGGERRLDIPASLAYGSSGSGTSIPPNAELVFDITLTAVS
jgi:hypothetical protein